MAYQSVWYYTDLPEKVVDLIEEDIAEKFDGDMGDSKLHGDSLNKEKRNSQNAILHLLGSLIILLVTVFINEDRYKNEVLVLITILISSLFFAFIFIKNFDFEKNKTKLNKYFFDLISVFNFKVIKVNKLELIFHSLTHLLFGFINLYLIFKLVGFDSMFIESVYFNLITSLSSVATITPGNIGILELIHVLFKELYSLSAGEVVFISVISRIASLISLMTLNILTKINKNTLF